jgi:CheY-like chemotaxis protein
MVKARRKVASLRVPLLSHDAVVVNMEILVASSDPAYRQVMSFLLARRGFAVAEARSADVLTTLRAPEHRNLRAVLLDASGLLDETTRIALLIEEFHPELTTVVVADELDSADGGRSQSRSILKKWDAFEDLVEAIEASRVPA